MVYLSLVRCVRSRGPDRYWRRKAIFDQTQHFYGRRRNCYKIAINAVHKKWQHITRNRIVKRREYRRLWIVRLNAGVREHGMKYHQFIGNLGKYDVELNRNILSNLAVFEPKTFKCLVELAKRKHQEGLLAAVADNPDRVINRLTTQEDILSEAIQKLRLNSAK